MCAYSFTMHYLASCLPFILHVSCMVSYKDYLYKLLLVQVMAAPTMLISADENFGDPIDIRVDIIHLEHVAAVAFPVETVVRTLARHEEVIGGIQDRLLEMPTKSWEEIEEELLTLRERANKAETEGITLHAKVRSLELIETWLHGIVRDERESRERIFTHRASALLFMYCIVLKDCSTKKPCSILEGKTMNPINYQIMVL
nr:hypothetical protein [Tanacetum cinerariifolium]